MFQTVYVSQAIYPMGHPSDAGLLRDVRRQAADLGVSGFLLRTEWAFAGAFEGPRASVAQIVAETEADPRHRTIRTWPPYPITTRTFRGWSMGYGPMNRDGLLGAHGPDGTRALDPVRLLRLLKASAAGHGDDTYGALHI